jgi:hypothetical protein
VEQPQTKGASVKVDHLIIGEGEVGSALLEVLRRGHQSLAIRDEAPSASDPNEAETLHIAFPFGGLFVQAVAEYRMRYRARIVVIHSTVPVGTAAALDACASPIRGKHPHLAQSILTFVKFFAGTGAAEAASAFAECGVRTELVADPETVEAGKLWDLLQYAIAITIQKQMWQWCIDNGIDPAVAYTRFNRTYNEGYEALGEPQFVRPVLTDIPGPIGGHCVITGSAMIEHPLADLVLRANAQTEELPDAVAIHG